MIKVPKGIQEKICETNGKYVVRACPGSGKTFTVAAKMAKLLEKWPYDYQGVAVISFTNVAWQEIEKELKNSFFINTPIKHPHFLGTIDSFINQFIFLQYGHLAINCDSRPTLVGEPVYPWKSKEKDWYYNQFFDKVSYDVNGNMKPIKKLDFTWQELKNDGSEDKNYYHIKRMKKNFREKKGYVNQSDVDYFSMKLLKDYPSIAETIALRFPFIIIDEVQDTSKIQMEIIDMLVESEKLENMILVGDPDQAIFEWNGANPDLFNDKFYGWDDSIIMNKNWRSSQNICNFTYRLSSLNKKSEAVNEDFADCKHDPEIIGYDPANVDFNKELINPFLKECEKNDIILNPSNVAILARSSDLVDKINLSRSKHSMNGIKGKLDMGYPDNFTKELANSRYLYDKSKFQESFKLLEKTYICILEKSSFCSDYKLKEVIEKKGYFTFKEEILKLMQLMPKTDNISLGEWKDKFQKNLSKYTIFQESYLKIKEEYRDFNFDDLFGIDVVDSNTNYLLSTVHKVKGETFKAVLLILKQNPKGSSYKNLLDKKGKNKPYHEELRTVYVGITRPRSILFLAVPFKQLNLWDGHFNQSSLDRFFNQ